jgi:hypothetical protein
MSTITTRSGKGSPLTNAEVDANFTNLNTDKLELSDLSAGTWIGLSSGGQISNSAPDQTVALTGAGATSISGTYPSFTITSTNTTYSVGDGGLTQNNFTDADHTKLNGIEASATADQTAAEIRTLVEGATDSNVFTDADHTKLNNAGTQSVVTTAPTSASGFANGHVWYVVS